MRVDASCRGYVLNGGARRHRLTLPLVKAETADRCPRQRNPLRTEVPRGPAPGARPEGPRVCCRGAEIGDGASRWAGSPVARVVWTSVVWTRECSPGRERVSGSRKSCSGGRAGLERGDRSASKGTRRKGLGTRADV